MSDRTCPICLEPYVEPVRGGPSPADGAGEWAVRIDMIAEQSGLRRCCGHILGRICLEKHLQGEGPWRNKCPLCRNLWFHVTVANHAATDEQPRASAERIYPQATLRRSSRIASRAAVRQPPSAHHDRYRVNPRTNCTLRNAGRSPHFMRHLLGLLNVSSGSDEVKATLEEVERRLGILYES